MNQIRKFNKVYIFLFAGLIFVLFIVLFRGCGNFKAPKTKAGATNLIEDTASNTSVQAIVNANFINLLKSLPSNLTKELEEVTNTETLTQDIIEQHVSDYFDDDNYALMNVKEIKKDLENDPEFTKLDPGLKCTTLVNLITENKCIKSKRKFLKIVVRNIGSGKFSINKDKIDVTTPSSITFKNEVNRINLILESYYQSNIDYCNRSGNCKSITFAVECDPTSATMEMRRKYDACTDILIRTRYSGFTEVLRVIANNLDEFEKGQISDTKVKAIVNARLDAEEKEKSNADKTIKRTEESIDTTKKESSTKDSTKGE